MIFNIVCFALSIFFFFYFILMQILSPEPFFRFFVSFSTVWLLLSVVFALIPFFRKKNFFKNFSQKLKIGFLSFCALCLVIGSVHLVQILTPKHLDENSQVKYVILLGGGITKDCKISKMVQKRVEKCAEFLKKNPDAVCVVSGGKLAFMPCSEGEILKPALCEYGISEERILTEQKALDTIENFQNSVKLICETENVSVQSVLDSSVAIVTSNFHIARAERLAERMGFSDIHSVSSKVPFPFVLNVYAREICSYIKLNLRILFTGKPSALL